MPYAIRYTTPKGNLMLQYFDTLAEARLSYAIAGAAARRNRGVIVACRAGGCTATAPVLETFEDIMRWWDDELVGWDGAGVGDNGLL